MRINKEESKIKIPRFPNLKDDEQRNYNVENCKNSLDLSKVHINNDNNTDDCEENCLNDEDDFNSVLCDNNLNKSNFENSNKGLEIGSPDQTFQGF